MKYLMYVVKNEGFSWNECEYQLCVERPDYGEFKRVLVEFVEVCEDFNKAFEGR